MFLTGTKFAGHSRSSPSSPTSPDGRSTDPLIERKLQRLLGGPLDTMSNDQTGWSRKSGPARIAGLTLRPTSKLRSPLPLPQALRRPSIPVVSDLSFTPLHLRGQKGKAR